MPLIFEIILFYYAAINLLLLILMGIDKIKAIKNKWRIPESTLFIFSLLGGFFGGFAGMYLFRHKTQKLSFHVVYLVSFILHTLLLVLFYKYIASSELFSVMLVK